jgi:NCS2 family nucleobase:cation symporter-2
MSEITEVTATASAANPGRAAAHPVDAILPPLKLLVLAIQHVLTMYAGAVTVPLVIGAALHLATDQTAYLVSSDLLACGIVTIIQCMGVGFIGVRLPIMMGVTFVAVGPGIAIAANPALGLPGLFGASLVSGVAGLFIAPLFGRVAWLFSSVVTGTAMLLIGVSLMGVAVTWVAGGVSGAAAEIGGMAIALLVLASILAIVRFGRGMIANTAVLIGVSVGFAAACLAGMVDLSRVASAPWLSVVMPLHFGPPRFDALAAASMTVVMLITMVESSGMLFALSRITDKPLTSPALARGLRADAVGALLGGFFNSLPYTSYSQNVAIVAMTGVKSRFVCAGAGVILVALGALPKLSFLVTAIPPSVIGGAALVMFGMVAANGVQTLGRIDFSADKRSLYVVALGLSVGLIPLANDKFFDKFPPSAAGFLHNGTMLGIVTALVLNILLNGKPKTSAEIVPPVAAGSPAFAAGDVGEPSSVGR